MKGIDFHWLCCGTHHHQLPLPAHHWSFSDSLHNNLSFRLQNNLGYCWNINKGKSYKSNVTPGVAVRPAAASSSPALGASDYSEELLSAQQQKKKKQESIAGVDQEELVDPIHLADTDSCFCEFKGVDIHYKVCEAEQQTPNEVLQNNSNRKIGLPVLLLHGFGASTFSWHRVMKPFAQITGSKVLAFDRPAFGLTSRVSHSVKPQRTNDKMPLNPYSLAFSVLATIYFIDFLSSKKAVLVGHSAGCLTAVEAYFEAPDRVAALILVAPAILSPRSTEQANKDSQQEKENLVQESNSGSYQPSNQFLRLGRQILSRFFVYISTTIMQLLKAMVDMAKSLYRKALAVILRSAVALALVRMIIDKFGISAIRNAWYDASQVSDHVLRGYTKPLRTKNWDRALIEHTVAMLTDSQTKPKPPLQKRLQEIACPVLIITGDNDRLVPTWNSVRLSQVIPGSQVEVIENCGHLPQEEKPDVFLSIVAKFLPSIILGEELCLQT